MLKETLEQQQAHNPLHALWPPLALSVEWGGDAERSEEAMPTLAEFQQPLL